MFRRLLKPAAAIVLLSTAGSAHAATPTVPIITGFPRVLSTAADHGHVASNRGFAADFAAWTEGRQVKFYDGTTTISVPQGARSYNPEFDGTNLVWSVNDPVLRRYAIYRADMTTSPPTSSQYSASNPTKPLPMNPVVDNGRVVWQDGPQAQTISRKDVSGGSIFLHNFASGWTGDSPSLWHTGDIAYHSVVASRVTQSDSTGTHYIGVTVYNPSVSGDEADVRIDAYVPSWQTDRSFVPSVYEGRLAYVANNKILYRDIDIEDPAKTFAYAVEQELSGLPKCDAVYYPRVGGTQGKYIIWTGENCDDGALVLYLTNTLTHQTYFIDDQIGGRTMSDWTAVPYDIDLNQIVYEAGGVGTNATSVKMIQFDEDLL